MSRKQRRVLVTGGAGFIGSALCRHLIQDYGHRVVNVDRLTYAGNPASLDAVANDLRYRFERCDIADEGRVSRLLREEEIDGVIHLAAETHVDRSIASPHAFIETNVLGTFRLLEVVLDYWRGLGAGARSAFRFHHVSTDEVFGDAEEPAGLFSETRYRPSSPYSASKAASDHLVGAWYRTYGLPALITNSTNTYGPYQFPDKLIPLIITKALQERPLPVYGTGSNLRDWLYVEDHVRALGLAFSRGRPGQSYHFSGGAIHTNTDVVRRICHLLDERRSRASSHSYEELIAFVRDRPGHDRRYRLDVRSARNELGWTPSESFESGLVKTVDWYLEREEWWRPLQNIAEEETVLPHRDSG